MKIKFIDYQYQTDAVESIVDIFEGSEIKDSPFTIDISKDYKHSKLVGEGVTYLLGHGNRLTLSDHELLENTRSIQERNGILKSTDINGRNFTIEMETGTGKTYVYIKTILELHKRYGFTKYIIVVPSIAIKEGVNKSFEITKDHFMMKYDNEVYRHFVYDSSKLNDVQTFATNTNIEVMIINIDAFRRSFTDPSRETVANIIHRESDHLSGNKPIDLIASTNPIVIIDEPQSVDNTPKAKEAIKALNPMCTLRYSATHREVYNLMYRLTPVDAYQENLVKQIEVASVESDKTTATPYVKLLSINTKNEFTARLEINTLKKDGSISKATVTTRVGEDLWEKSNYVDYYKDQNYIVDDIFSLEDEDYIYFTNGLELAKGEAVGEVNQDAIKRAQIRNTIRLHLEKEETYLKQGIKVLSLFFIDRVDKYRIYDEEGNQQLGEYGVWFEEEYEKLINGRFRRLKETYKNKISFNVGEIHDGYFSIDRRGRVKDTRGESKDDETTYNKIMRDKERLLKFEEPLRFIFSHSALKEGWDNPNVYQVCTLVESKDTMTKRQKIGRGLRIGVNQDGDRVNDIKFNKLTVIANESYKDFASGLQRELETEAGYKFGIVEKVSFSGIEITTEYGVEKMITQEESVELYNYLTKNKYLKSNGKVEEKFFLDERDGNFEVPEELEIFKEKIITTIKRLSRNIVIKNEANKRPIKLNKKVVLSPEFEEMWKRIKRKTLYSVNMDINKFKQEAIDKIENMPRIRAERIYSEKADLDITSKGVIHEDSAQYRVVGSISEFANISYPDFIRRLQDSTRLLRKTIIEILHESGRLSEFYDNPELFIKNVSNILNQVKRNNISKGLKYYQIEEFYVQSDIFDDTEYFGYLGKDIIDLSQDGDGNNKHIYDYVKFDSAIEKHFAEDAQKDDDVVLFGKLPNRFVIDTPFGNYNPDWIVVMQTDGEDKLYFVTETKGSSSEDDLRQRETNKILAGRKHFEVLDTDVKFEVVSKLKELKN